jgi:hypothetical protein
MGSRLCEQVHPDLFGNYPELKEKNELALQALMSVLEEARAKEGPDFVPTRSVHVEFYARTGVEGQFLRLPGHLRLTGNNCHHVLGKSLSDLFTLASLPSQFRWGSDYWSKKVCNTSFLSVIIVLNSISATKTCARRTGAAASGVSPAKAISPE